MKYLVMFLILFTVSPQAQDLLLYTGETNLVLDPGFDGICGDNFWVSCQAGWAITGSKGVATATVSNMVYNVNTEAATTYAYSITISDYVAGTLRIELGGFYNSAVLSGNGTFTGTILTILAHTQSHLDARTTFTGKIDDFSLIKQ